MSQRDLFNINNVVQFKPRAALREEWMKGWDLFYLHYPRHIAAQHGKKAWAQLMPRHRHQFRDKFDAIMRRLNHFKRHEWRDRTKEHIPYPATWLRAEDFGGSGT